MAWQRSSRILGAFDCAAKPAAELAQQECGWKGGDRGGLAEQGKWKKIMERAENS
jgi:hypothetical protein